MANESVQGNQSKNPVVGTVKSLFRFPVKSMGGESLEQIQVTPEGFSLDRTWAIYDKSAGEIRGAKKIPELMKFNAEYKSSNVSGAVSPEVQITGPNGEVISSGEGDCSEKLSALLGKEVKLTDLKPASDLAHYRLARKMNENQMREILGLDDDEPIPDFSDLPVSMLLKLQYFVTPPGTYFDAYPLHLLTTGSLQHMSKLSGNDNYVVDRFRPNLFIDSFDAEGFAELNWCHQKVKIGEAIIQIDGHTPRCSMPGRAQKTIDADKKIARQLFELADRNLGVYASVIKPGVVRVGDQVELLRDNRSALVKGIESTGRKVKKRVIDFFM